MGRVRARFDHDGDDEGEKKNRIHFFVFFGFFSYNKPENKPGTRKKTLTRLEMREKKKEHHEVKKEYLKTGFFRRMIPIELDPAEGGAAREWAFHIDG